MKESTFYRSVARITGESVRRLRRMGFALVIMPDARELREAERTRPPGRSRQAVSGVSDRS